MQVIGGLVTGLNLVLGCVIAVRLLRLGARTKGPERWLGLFFLFGLVLGTVLSAVVYMGWSDPALALPEAWLVPLHAAHQVANGVAGIAIGLFTWKTFRAGDSRARGVVVGGGVALLLSIALVGWLEGFEVRVVNGPAYWLAFALRVGAIAWMAAESLLYYLQLRRRRDLGLAEPLVTNRFLLWGIWASLTLLMGLSDPLARIWYYLETGTTSVWIPSAGHSIIVATLGLTSALGCAAAATLILTFFPTPAYRRWIEARASA